jgi:predicted ATPase
VVLVFFALMRLTISALIILCSWSKQTVDVFAVLALSGILSRLLSTGTVLVATSNRAPEELNQVCFISSFMGIACAVLHSFIY